MLSLRRMILAAVAAAAAVSAAADVKISGGFNAAALNWNGIDTDPDTVPYETEPPAPLSPLIFRPPFKAFDPYHYQWVFSHFAQCTAQCARTSSYSPFTVADISSNSLSVLNALGLYTACVSACVASEIVELVSYYKESYAKLLDVTEHQLRLTKGYIANTNDLDFLGNRTRIGYACVLPDEYFVEWSKLTVQVALKLPNNDPGPPAYVRAELYLSYCTAGGNDLLDNVNGLGGLQFACDAGTTNYLQALQQSVGHNILHPDLVEAVPPGQCTKGTPQITLKPNPVAARYTGIPGDYEGHVCVLQKTRNGVALIVQAGGVENPEDADAYVTDLIVMDVNPATGACDSYELDDATNGNNPLTLTFTRVSTARLELFTVTGLPHSLGSDACDLTDTLPVAPSGSTADQDWYCVNSLTNIPFYDANLPDPFYNGPLEYATASQYLNYLTYQVSSTALCNGVDFFGFVGDNIDTFSLTNQLQTDLTRPTGEFPLNVPSSDGTYSIICLYRIFSLKCDCMKAVLNCYTLEAHYASALGQTLGRAASVLCGLVLCQKEPVYKLFMDAAGESHTAILAQVLLEASGQIESGLSSAVLMLLSVGAGMVAFVAAKHLAPRAKSTMEDGYANLI
ncbi:Aste57867_18590 [Aphanomyces stellatus]|uniref:Aste57867_18590 protein n=1 Tax=Aphanomyces stellatus TaxID=120398 RepID=A0A485LAQ8_9STRA|nr:hypothetical protein As57867_018528 [Aphanomyces stellatus]VFT95325.1 Aste57867_18590 [Aphanomyces stellatus]